MARCLLIISFLCLAFAARTVNCYREEHDPHFRRGDFDRGRGGHGHFHHHHDHPRFQNNDVQSDDPGGGFKWQAVNTGQQNQPLYVPLNENNAVNWLAYLSPDALAAAGYNTQQIVQPQQQQDPFANFDKYFPSSSSSSNRPFPSSGRGTSRFENQQWQQYLQATQNPSYGGLFTPSAFNIPQYGGNPYANLNPFTNPLYIQGLQQLQQQQPNLSVLIPPVAPPARPSPTTKEHNEGQNSDEPSAPLVRPPVRPPMQIVTRPPPVLVPATSTTTSAPTTTAAPLACEKTADGSGCYAFVKEKKRFVDAIRYCKAHGMYLASIAESNAKLINQMVLDNLGSNETSKSRPCYERITMLANFEAMRSMRYGTYAFTTGAGECAQPADDSSYLFDVCAKEFDCSLVDWNYPNAFVCAKDDKYEAWCTEPIFSDSYYDYMVTCKPIPGAVEELNYPPMCQPFEYGSDVVEYAPRVQAFKHTKEVSLLGNFVIPGNGVIKFCFPDDACASAAYKDQQYGLCRREIGIVDTTEPVQLWPKGVIPYRFAGWDASLSKNITAVKDAMQLIQSSSNACFKFVEAQSGKNYSGVVEILPGRQPNACSMEAIGRKTGVQSIIYGGDCFNKIGTILRLLMHTIGVPAEHTRFDRDDYITIHQDLLNQEPTALLQTYKQSIPGKISLQTPYDYDSVTHYPPEAVARQKGLLPFESKKPDGPKIGQRTHLSEGDKKKIQVLYGECKQH